MWFMKQVDPQGLSQGKQKAVPKVWKRYVSMICGPALPAKTEFFLAKKLKNNFTSS